MDAYRIASEWEAEELDIDRMLQQGVLLVEWAEQIRTVLPKESLWITMNYIEEEQRSLILRPEGKRYIEIAREFRQNCFGV